MLCFDTIQVYMLSRHISSVVIYSLYLLWDDFGCSKDKLNKSGQTNKDEPIMCLIVIVSVSERKDFSTN